MRVHLIWVRSYAIWQVRCCKVVLRNRGMYKMYIKVDSSAAPFLDSLTFNDTDFLAPGVPRVIDVTTRLHGVSSATYMFASISTWHQMQCPWGHGVAT